MEYLTISARDVLGDPIDKNKVYNLIDKYIIPDLNNIIMEYLTIKCVSLPYQHEENYVGKAINLIKNIFITPANIDMIITHYKSVIITNIITKCKYYSKYC